MSDITYFLWAMLFNHGLKVLLIIVLVFGWSDVMACGTLLADPVIINCMGCL
jgi:hypothetical protein